jgi:hypothetical protein
MHAKDGMREGAEHLTGLALFEQLALEEQPGAVATRRLVHGRCRDQDRHALRQKVVEKVPELAATHRVDAVGRLVEQEHLGLVEQRARERELLVHAAREGLGAPVLELGEARDGEEPLAAFSKRVPRETEHLPKEREVLGDGQIAVKTVLLRHVAQRFADARVLPEGVLSDEANLSSGRIEQPSEHPQRRGLSRAVWPHEPIDFARGHVQGQPIDRFARLEATPQIGRLDPPLRVAHCQLPSIATSTGIPERRRRSAFGIRTSTE